MNIYILKSYIYDEKIAVIEKQLRPSICEMVVKLQLQIDLLCGIKEICQIYIHDINDVNINHFNITWNKHEDIVTFLSFPFHRAISNTCAI